MDNAAGGVMGDPQDVVAERIVRELLMPHHGNSNATITVQGAAPWQLWICATACVAILCSVIVGSVIGGIWLMREFQAIDKRTSDQEVKIDRANVLLSATWQHIPEVAEKVKSEHPEESSDAE